MKKFLTLLLLASTFVSFAQESVLLRLNYKKGDSYTMTIKQNVSSPQMLMDMTMTANQNIVDVDGDIYNSETKFNRIVMTMMQGANELTYDSNMKDDELDQMGLMLKGQMSPMLDAVISAKGDKFGNVIEAKATPDFQGSENLGESNILYPEKALRVGDTFKMEKDSNGMTMSFVYKLLSINKNEVVIDVTGKVSGMGTGDIKGTMTVDSNSGVAINSDITTKVNVQGQDVTTVVKTTITKN